MNENKNIMCTVKKCEYHTKNDYCSADKILVSNENATSSDETLCDTFIQKF